MVRPGWQLARPVVTFSWVRPPLLLKISTFPPSATLGKPFFTSFRSTPSCARVPSPSHFARPSFLFFLFTWARFTSSHSFILFLDLRSSLLNRVSPEKEKPTTGFAIARTPGRQPLDFSPRS